MHRLSAFMASVAALAALWALIAYDVLVAGRG
jgi:hypothetical protein